MSGVEFYTKMLKSAVEVAYAFNASDAAVFCVRSWLSSTPSDTADMLCAE